MQGRSVVFVPSDCDSAEMASVIEEQHCEVLLVKRSPVMSVGGYSGYELLSLSSCNSLYRV